ncbi:Calcium/calmodulin-dependent protein kinase [Bertholletia excelsa]
MVQRKVPSKLGIHLDHVKSEKLLGSLGPSSPRHQYLKKKKMRKSRSIKPSESLRSSPAFRREVPQPGKPPPPLDVAATPQKQSPLRKSDASPNYMKSTSSSAARKERSQVSSRSFQASIDNKSPKKITSISKHGLNSGHKPAKTLARTSSLKVVRTLTKSPCFKPVRASAKKCSQAALCENLNAQRATCSSTLKDSKFPSYLALSPGATESEGTSAMKVCPYTYCSLNGHRHAPLPPLKGFLSARRRMLKIQKSIKMGCLSPRQAKPPCDGIEKITGKIISELDSGPEINPLVHDDHMDFFIEIYARDVEYLAKETEVNKQGDDKDKITLLANDFTPSVSGSNEVVVEDDDQQTEESLSEEAPHSEVNFEDDIDESSELVSMEMDITKFPEEVQNVKIAEEEHSSTQQQDTTEGLRKKGGLEVQSPTSNELDETDFDTSDMEWEEGQCSALFADDEACNGYERETGTSILNDNHSFHNEPILKSDNISCTYLNEIQGGEGVEELFEEVGTRSSAGCSDCIVSSTDHVVEESLAEDKGDVHSNNLVASTVSLAPIEVPIKEQSEDRGGKIEDLETDSSSRVTKLLLEDVKTESTGNSEDEALVDYQENRSHRDSEATALLRNQEFDHSSHTSAELDQDTTHKDGSSSDSTTEVYNSTAVDQEESFESPLSNIDDPETHESLDKEFHPVYATGKMKGEEDGASEIRILTPNFLEDLSETDQSMAKEEKKAIQLATSIEKDGEPNQVWGFKVSDSMDSEDQTASGLNRVSITEKNNEDVIDMKAEQSTASGLEESFQASKYGTSKKAKSAFSYGRNHSSQELPKASYNLRISRGKGPVEQLEEAREFNPREPNYLPIEPDPEAEKVDLKHQMMDERKNAEEWMLDYALQQAVTRLAPARKRKVALIIEAFEKVMPTPKYERHLRRTSAAFANPRAIQACS